MHTAAVSSAIARRITNIDRCGIQPWAGASVKDDATVDLAISNGAELITCNNPDVVLDLLRKKGYHG